MSKRLHNTKLHKDFKNKTKAQEDKRDKQDTKNDLRRLSHQEVDGEFDDKTDHYDDIEYD